MFACSLLNVRNRVSHEKIEVLNRRRAAGSSNIRAFQILTALAVFLAINVLADAPRERLLLDSGWRFQLGDPADLTNVSETNVAYYPEINDLAKIQTSALSGPGSETNLATLRPDPVATHMGENVSTVQTNFNDSTWQPINLPHDWVVALPFDSTADTGHGYKSMITGAKSPTTIGWYRHTFTLPSTYANKTMWLEFDGAYRNCLVWLNGHILGRHVSGYTSFSFDVSQYANPGGTNTLVVRVDASRFEGWFYEGAGIYRHVWLVKTDPVHIAHWGTYVTNLVNGANATVTIQSQVNNDGSSSATCNLASTILDPNGNLIANTTQSVTIGANTNQIVTQTVTVTNAQLWSLNSPALYKLVSTVSQGTTTNDIYQTHFGIRTITWDPKNGMSLNGQRVQLQGMCNHQDHAGVGIALPDRVHDFRVERLKEMGCNTWRTSHGSPDPELLDECDRVGMLVLDENRRVGVDPETLGEVQSHIVRDRNHPCVFAWSLGNEETAIQGTATGAAVMTVMQNLAYQLDRSRLCTVAQDGSWGSVFSTGIDVQGINYTEHGNIDTFHTSFPSQPLMGTEEGGGQGERGMITNTSTCKSVYDLGYSGYAKTAQQWLQYYAARPWAAGACNWTGFDYRGEPAPFIWPNINSQFGPVDTCGFAKDIYYYYQANWTQKPVLHVLPQWNSPLPGQTVAVWVFSDCNAVQLFLNGVSQGQKSNFPMTDLVWNLLYAAGTLQAVGYINGQAVMTNTVTTTGAPAAITLQPDRQTITADGRDVSMVTVSVIDSQGRVVPTATNTLNFTVTGGIILGLGNGDPADHESDKATNNVGLRSVFSGLAQVIVQSTNQAGTITLTATAAGLASTNVVINESVNPPVPDAPAGPVVITGSGQVWLSWDVVPEAVTYNLKRSLVSGGPYTTIVSNTAGLVCFDTNVASATTYYYVLSAVNANGESTNSAEATATLPFVPPIFATQPSSFTNAHPVYAGVPVTFSAQVNGSQPIYYQWYQIINGATNAIVDATNSSYTYLSPNGDTTSVIGFFLVASNGATNMVSSVANLINLPSPSVIIKASTTTLNGSGDWIPAAVPGNS